MYICKDCGAAFEEPAKIEYVIIGWYAETHFECPECGSRFFHEADKCCCGGWKSTEEYFCKDCGQAVIKRFREQFDEEERNFICDENQWWEG